MIRLTRCNTRFAAAAAVGLAVLTLVIADRAAAQVLQVQVNGNRVQVQAGPAKADAPADDKADKEAKAEKDDLDFFRPTMNTSIEAENTLRLARNLADTAAYAEASERYLDLVTKNFRAMDEGQVGSGYFLPLWRITINEISKWPAAGLEAYRSAAGAAARNEFREAVAAADLARIERVAQQYFLTEIGDNAAIMVADRCREAGWPALALYYYTMVLEKYPDSDVPRSAVLLRASLAAREAGLESRYAALAAQLAGATVAPDVAATETDAATWVAAQKSQPARPGDPSVGFGNQASSPPVAPATITWDVPLASKRTQQNVYGYNMTTPGTPPIYPTLSGETLYLANLTSAWAVDARAGAVLWRYDTRETDGEGLPAIGTAQARQPLAVDGVVYVPLEKPPAKGRQVNNPFMGGIGSSVATDLYALDAATGRPLWKWGPQDGGLEFAEMSVDGQPVVAGDLVFVALCSPTNYFGETHSAALDRRTGKLVWAQPMAAYMANFTGGGNGWMPMADNAGTALAFRGGLLLSSGIGVTSAQSCLSGSVLWSRVMPDMPAPKTAGADRVNVQQRGASLVHGMRLARRPRVLADRGLVIAGFILSPNLWAYDWLDGSVLWQQPAQGARQPLAISGNLVLAWGSTMMTFDLQTGKALRTSAAWPEPIVGEPIVSQGKVLAPTQAGIIMMDVAGGTIDSTTVLPPDVPGGNLALGRYGLIITSDKGAVCMHDWETAKKQFLAMAEDDPEDPQPLLALGAAALRLEKTEAGLEYLDGALARDPDDEQRKKIYQLFEDFYRLAYLRSSRELMIHVLDRLEESATSGATRCRQAFLRAEFVGAGNPHAALAAIQQVLDDPASRQTRVSGPTGPGVSGILVEEAIGRLIAAHGRDLYRPWENLAAAARQKARLAADYDALLEVAMRYPNSLSARLALDDALSLLIDRKDVNEANRLLIRLVNLAGAGEAQRRYRALLVDTSAQLGDLEFALLAAEGLSHTSAADARVTRADGSTTTVAELLRIVAEARDKAAPAALPSAESQLPDPPLRLAWSMQPNANNQGMQQIVRRITASDGESDLALPLDNELIWSWNMQRVIAVNRSDGKVRWEYLTKQNDPMRYSGGQPFIGRTGLYVPNGGQLTRLDPATGQKSWTVHLQPASRRQFLAPQEALGGVLVYGDTGWRVGAREPVQQFEELGGKLIAGSRFCMHLIDPRDGYTIRSIGYPAGTYYGGVIRYGSRAMLIPSTPARLQSHVFLYDLATGNLERDLRFGGQVFPSSTAPHGARYWPLFVQSEEAVCVVDLATGKVAPPLSVSGIVNRGYQGQPAIADARMLYVMAQNANLKAIERQTGKVLWTYEPPDKQMTRMSFDADGRLIVSSRASVVALQAGDGQVLWTQDFGKGGINNIQPGVMAGRRLVVSLTRQSRQNWQQYSVLLDTTSGKVLFEFNQPGENATQMLLADEHGYLVMRGNTGTTEYWTHDPAGLRSWGEKKPEEVKPEKDDGNADSDNSE